MGNCSVFSLLTLLVGGFSTSTNTEHRATMKTNCCNREVLVSPNAWHRKWDFSKNQKIHCRMRDSVVKWGKTVHTSRASFLFECISLFSKMRRPLPHLCFCNFLHAFEIYLTIVSSLILWIMFERFTGFILLGIDLNKLKNGFICGSLRVTSEQDSKCH